MFPFVLVLAVILTGIAVWRVWHAETDAPAPPVPRHEPNRAFAATTRTNALPPRVVQPVATLANRTIDFRHERTKWPAVFAAKQKPSTRGTVAYVLAANQPVTRAVREVAQNCGARVIGFLPKNALLVEATGKTLRKLAHEPIFAGACELGPQDKVQPGLRETLKGGGPQLVTIQPLMVTDAALVAEALRAKGAAVREVGSEGRGFVRCAIDSELLEALVQRGDVKWVERYVPPRLLNDVAATGPCMNVEIVRGDVHGLDGTGQYVSTSDSGVDTGDLSSLHADLKDAVCALHTVQIGRWSSTLKKDIVGHGTHTAGSIAGRGTQSDGQFKGIACGAKMDVICCSDSSGNLYTPSNLSKLFYPSGSTYPIYIHSASWGGTMNAYTSESQNLDSYLWQHPDFLPVFAAGNGWQNDSGYFTHAATSICCQAAAKNVLAVGACQNERPSKGSNASSPAKMAYFSSRGPLPDGRIKPDIVAPGTYVVSTRSTQASSTGWGVYNDYYLYNGGTSMATPLTAGAVTIVRQWLVERCGFTNATPTAALMKAIITGGASDLSRESGSDVKTAAPNKDEGFGRVNLGETIYPTNRAVRLYDRLAYSEGSATSFQIVVTNTGPLDVQLAWTDYPAEVSAATTASLVNDLDLEVTLDDDGDTMTWYGNGGTTADRVNNLEGVHLASAAPGLYTITVKGTAVTYDSTEGGAAAVYVRGALSEDVVVNYSVAATLPEGRVTELNPEAGNYSCSKGSTITLSADWACATNQYGTYTAAYVCTGWVGSGSVPASGTSNQVTVTFDAEKSTIRWLWADAPSYYRLGLFTYMLDSDLQEYGLYPTAARYWADANDPITFAIPQESPLGPADSYAWNGPCYFYYGSQQWYVNLTTLHYCGFGVADLDANFNLSFADAKSFYAAPTSFTVPMDKPYDVYFCYCDATSTNATTALPEWWQYRYLEGACEAGALTDSDLLATADPDGDGFTNAAELENATHPLDPMDFKFTIDSFAFPTINWTGGINCKMVVERAETPAGPWVGVWSNAAPSSTSQSVTLTSNKSSTNEFYRIRAFER